MFNGSFRTESLRFNNLFPVNFYRNPYLSVFGRQLKATNVFGYGPTRPAHFSRLVGEKYIETPEAEIGPGPHCDQNFSADKITAFEFRGEAHVALGVGV